ncbi:reverse transcriptase domain-containing protein [Tanacetum coccineum]
MAPKKRTTSLNPETTSATTATTTTNVTNAQLQAMIDQGVTAVLAARDANTNGVDSHNSGTCARRNERATRDCTYPDFIKYKPLNFKGTEGVFSTCTLLGNALTWWNSHIRTVGNDIAYAMTWAELKKMTNKYCPRTKIKKLEVKLWELNVKGTVVIGYNQHFQELALLCGKMFLEESDKIEKYVGGLPDMIHGSVVASKPKTMQEATEMSTEVMDKRIHTFAHRQQRIREKKMITNNNNKTRGKTPTGRTLQGLVRRSHTGDLNPYALNATITTMVHVLPNATSATELVVWPATSDCPELKNRNHENQAEGTEARGMVYAFGGGETEQDLNNIKDEIEA